MFILSSISGGLQRLWVNHTSIYRFWIKRFWKYKNFGEISNNWSNDLLGANV